MDEYSILDIAKWFLAKESMSNKKIQKLSYYATAWGYALLGESITNDGVFEGWIHGPVSPILYNEYKGKGWQNWDKIENFDIAFDEKISNLLNLVWNTYGDKTADSLEALTHTELPWIEARIGLDDFENGNKKLDPETMGKFYRSIYIGD